ncbi:MAG: hypothetical protein LC620_08610 [Halobacteriales archaeon]|nr:hypothetical protein [Halobacteriales archaeon]
MWRLLAVALLLAGCTQPAEPQTAVQAPSDLVIIAHNNATAPAWFRLSLLRDGTTLVDEERAVQAGQTTEWRQNMRPGEEYAYGLRYAAAPTGLSGSFGVEGKANATLCPGRPYTLHIFSGLLENGEPSMHMSFEDAC